MQEQSKKDFSFYFIDWSSHKQKQILHSGGGAIILTTKASEHCDNQFKIALNMFV